MDCGVACVAMLAGVSYAKALDAFDDKPSAVEDGNYAPALRAALIKLGRRPTGRLIKFPGYDRLVKNAILKVNLYNKGADWHWVVWDANRKARLDPWVPPYIKQYRPVACLMVE